MSADRYVMPGYQPDRKENSNHDAMLHIVRVLIPHFSRQ
jgi:hypothetical protein